MKRRALLFLPLLAALVGALPVQRTAGAEEIAKVQPRPKNVPSPAVIAALRHNAERGDMHAQYDLAIVLDCGLGVRRDPVEAVAWLDKAAVQGHVGAQSALGWKYMTGDGIGRNDDAAFQWLRRAAERGNTAAQNNLGILYAQGRGVAADAAEAVKWFRLAADKGAVDARRNLQALQAGRTRDIRPSAQRLQPRA